MKLHDFIWIYVFSVGVRATVPNRNVEVPKSLGIVESLAQKKVQSALAQLAAAHLYRIVP
jgi:hypothetical protein